jgi:hypothetical protein
MFLSGESGSPTLIETAKRIATAKGIPDVSAMDVFWGTALPQVNRQNHDGQWGVEFASGGVLREVVAKVCPAVVVFDPLYVMLGSSGKVNAANLFDMGPVLSALVEATRPATPVLIHHATKDIRPGTPMNLEDAAFSGCQEFARQWLLLNRRRPFTPAQEADVHKLLVAYGGSAGHNGVFALDINEGKLGSDFQGRTWAVECLTVDEAKERDAEARKAKEAARKEKRAASHVGKLLAAFPDGEPVSFTALRKATGLNSENLYGAIEEASGQVEEVQVEGRRGRYFRRTTAP